LTEGVYEYGVTPASAIFQLTTKQQEAFSRLRAKISEPILMTYGSNLKLKLACDASSYGVGAVLSDNLERPIAFASRILNKHEKMYLQIGQRRSRYCLWHKEISTILVRETFHARNR